MQIVCLWQNFPFAVLLLLPVFSETPMKYSKLVFTTVSFWFTLRLHPPPEKSDFFLLVQQGFAEIFPFFWQKVQTNFALDQRTCTWDEVQPQAMPCWVRPCPSATEGEQAAEVCRTFTLAFGALVCVCKQLQGEWSFLFAYLFRGRLGHGPFRSTEASLGSISHLSSITLIIASLR